METKDTILFTVTILIKQDRQGEESGGGSIERWTPKRPVSSKTLRKEGPFETLAESDA